MIGPGIPNPMMFAGGDPLDEFFKILRSVRFRSDATPRIERTTGASGGDRDKWFVLLNFKRGTLGAIQYLHGADTSSPDAIYINASDKLCIDIAGANRLISSRVFRDPAAHYIALVVFDAANATAASRLRVYVADSPSPEVTAWDTDARSGITAGSSKTMHNSILHVIGKNPAAANGYFDGYISEHRIGTWSGSQPTLFDHCLPHNRTGQWRPKAYSGGYGAHGSRLDFSDASSLVNLCLDRSGNGNSWTATNISLTPGPTCDSMLDTPTKNFATLSPLDVRGASVLSDGNLKEACSATVTGRASTIALVSGRWRAQATITGANGGPGQSYLTATVGIVPANAPATNLNSVGIGYESFTGDKYVSGAASAYGSAWNVSGSTYVIDIDLNIDSGYVEFYINGSPQGQIALPAIADGWVFKWQWPSIYGSGNATWNFGQQPWTHSILAGVKGVGTKNLPLFSGVVTISGTFTGNLNADGPFVFMNGSPETLTINGNPVTFGVHADRLANGFKLRTASSSYNASGNNTWTATILSPSIKSLFRYQNARGNP